MLRKSTKGNKAIYYLVWLATRSQLRRRVWYNMATIFILCCRNIVAQSDFKKAMTNIVIN